MSSDIFDILDSIEAENLAHGAEFNNFYESNIKDSTQSINSTNEEESNETLEEEIIDESYLSVSSSFHHMVDFIKKHHQDIPEQFRGKITIEPITNLTLAMYWVHIMKTSPIPKWMLHDPNITDSHGWTLAIHYITTNLTNPPEVLKHDPNIQTSTGKTAAMMLLLYRNEKNIDIPEWMRHDLNLTDDEHFTLIDYWDKTNDPDKRPSWMTQINQ